MLLTPFPVLQRYSSPTVNEVSLEAMFGSQKAGILWFGTGREVREKREERWAEIKPSYHTVVSETLSPVYT